jgi:DNA primase
LIERDGAGALRGLVEASVPFVVFHVDRILDRADTSSAEGRDRAALELAPVLALPPSALREDLLRRVASRLELSEGRLAALIARGAPAPARNGGGPAAARAPEVPDPAVRSEREFLVLCVALPDAGRRALSAIDPDDHLTSERMRRVARHLAGQTEMPLSGLAPDDAELARAVADIVARAGEAGEVTENQIEQQRLFLERLRLDRAIRRARGGGGVDVSELAHEREAVRERIRELDGLLEKPV